MASRTKFPYIRLRDEGWLDKAEEGGAYRKTGKRIKLRRLKRPTLRIQGLRRFLRRRSRLLTRVKVSWVTALRRLKSGQIHMNDLFGGNFLVMQVNPTPFRCGDTTLGV
ncbi:hypothetical protein SLA2020_039800 [Shorea laevis]